MALLSVNGIFKFHLNHYGMNIKESYFIYFFGQFGMATLTNIVQKKVE